MAQDQELKCRDCGEPFIFTVGEQEFFAQRQFNPPSRCKGCRDARKAQKDQNGGGNGQTSNYRPSNGNGPNNNGYHSAPSRQPAQDGPVVQYRSRQDNQGGGYAAQQSNVVGNGNKKKKPQEQRRPKNRRYDEAYDD